MRWFFRILTTCLWVLFAVIVGTLFRQNIEVLAESVGANNLLASGWSIVTGAGLEMWALIGFSFLSGVTATLWIDFFIRNHQVKNKKYPIVRAGWQVDPKMASEWRGKIMQWVATANTYTGKDAIWAYREVDPKLSKFGALVTIVFELDAKPDYCIHISSSRTILWKLVAQGRFFVTLELDFRIDEPVDMEVIIASRHFYGGSGTMIHVWSESLTIGSQQLFQPQNNKDISPDVMPTLPEKMFPDWWDVKVVKPSLVFRARSLLNTVSKKLPRTPRD